MGVLSAIYGNLLSLDWKHVFDRAKIARMFSINRDIFIRNTALLFTFMFFYSQGARGGDTVLAANAVLHNLVLLGAFFLEGITAAAEQLCGQSLGAGDANSFRKAVRLTLFLCFVFAAGFSLAALLLGGLFIDFLTTSAEVRAHAHDYLPFAAFVPLAGVLAFELDGVYIGAIWTRDMRNVMAMSRRLPDGESFRLSQAIFFRSTGNLFSIDDPFGHHTGNIAAHKCERPCEPAPCEPRARGPARPADDARAFVDAAAWRCGCRDHRQARASPSFGRNCRRGDDFQLPVLEFWLPAHGNGGPCRPGAWRE